MLVAVDQIKQSSNVITWIITDVGKDVIDRRKSCPESDFVLPCIPVQYAGLLGLRSKELKYCKTQSQTGGALASSTISVLKNRVCRPGACIPFPQSHRALHVRNQSLSQYSELPMLAKALSPGPDSICKGTKTQRRNSRSHHDL